MTDSFNFKLGRMRLNVERKRAFVQKHTEELEVMEEELKRTCPHAEVTTRQIMVQSNDFYHSNEPQLEIVCKVCGLTTYRRI